MMKSVLILLFVTIVGLGFYAYLGQDNAVNHKEVAKMLKKDEPHDIITKEDTTKSKPNTKKVEVDSKKVTSNNKEVESFTVTEETKSKSVPTVGEDLQNVSYEQIQNDTSLSDEEKERKIMDKAHYESVSETSSQSITEEEMFKLMEEDMKNGLTTN